MKRRGSNSRNWLLLHSCFTDEIETDFMSVFGGQARKVSTDRWTDVTCRTLGGLQAMQHMILITSLP
jgi:hypothetical protein